MYSVLATTSRSRPTRADLVADALPDGWCFETHELREAGIERGSTDALARAATGHDALILRPGVADRELFERAPSLRALAVYGSGYTRVDLRRPPTTVSSSPTRPVRPARRSSVTRSR